eukprot:NODE_2790_length_2145_cov_4.728940.p1 GENE.NODE_2790_length_2145_cov_4.728940~~NODE_2790_length_2145_cov_4.728940.p1  ORF type:complete len:578 (+),score=148.75 NODE_2790_length_2145_cov_4.728940:120-1736(+)
MTTMASAIGSATSSAGATTNMTIATVVNATVNVTAVAENTTAKLVLLNQTAYYGAVTAVQLADVVDNASYLLEDFSWSLAACSVGSGLFAAVIVAAAIARMVWMWPIARAAIATGAIKASPRWKPKEFHPVRAPGLPGMLCSCAVFSYLLIFAVVTIILLLFWWFPKVFDLDSDYWISSGLRMSTSIGTSILVKTLVLDKFIGRKMLTSKAGFVTHWAAFAWYILLIIPLTTVSGIALAISRFFFLLIICAFHVVRLDVTLFPVSIQSLDPGYTVFMSSLTLDHRHRNPIWTAFADTLTKRLREARTRATEVFVAENGAGHESAGSCHDVTCSEHVCDAAKRRERARRRWFLAVTLVNNPSLAFSRRSGRPSVCGEDATPGLPIESGSEPSEEASVLIEGEITHNPSLLSEASTISRSTSGAVRQNSSSTLLEYCPIEQDSASWAMDSFRQESADSVNAVPPESAPTVLEFSSAGNGHAHAPESEPEAHLHMDAADDLVHEQAGREAHAESWKDRVFGRPLHLSGVAVLDFLRRRPTR